MFNHVIARRRSPFLTPAFALLCLVAVTLGCSVDTAGDVAAAAATEPSVGPTTIVEEPAEPIAIMVALDTSLSMLAEDAEPNRFGGAQQAINAFLDEAPAEFYIGLVSFHGIATLEVAPTRDRAVVRSAIENLELDEATAIGEAIFTSLETLGAFAVEYGSDAPPGHILVLSDGETTVGRPDAAAIEQAQAERIPVSTIVFGTDAGTIQVPESDLPVPVPINDANLAEIANETGGDFRAATTTPELVEILTELAQRLGQ